MVKVRRGKPSSPAPSSPSSPSSSAPSTSSTSTSSNLPVSRIRKHLPAQKGKYFNPSSPHTPEGRLSQFNPEDWYVPAKDERGHGEKMMIELPPALLEELSGYVNSGKFPLGRSTKQAIRVAVFEFLQVLRRLEPVEDKHMSVIETANYVNRHAMMNLQCEETFNTGRIQVQRYLAAGAQNEARKLASDLISLAKQLPVQELREKHKQQLEREFRGLLSTGLKKISVKGASRKKKTPEWEEQLRHQLQLVNE